MQPWGVGHTGEAYVLSRKTPLVSAAVSHAGYVLECINIFAVSTDKYVSAFNYILK